MSDIGATMKIEMKCYEDINKNHEPEKKPSVKEGLIYLCNWLIKIMQTPFI
jgi:hypothetical protein